MASKAIPSSSILQHQQRRRPAHSIFKSYYCFFVCLVSLLVCLLLLQGALLFQSTVGEGREIMGSTMNAGDDKDIAVQATKAVERLSRRKLTRAPCLADRYGLSIYPIVLLSQPQHGFIRSLPPFFSCNLLSASIFDMLLQ